MEKTSLKDIINNSLEQVRSIIDADTVVGKEINTASGTTIIPISKISMGFASGGLDLSESGKNYTAGSGTGVSVYPIGFLVISPDGKVEMLPMEAETASPLEQITNFLDQTPSILNRIRAVFSGEYSEEITEEITTDEAEAAEAAVEAKIEADEKEEKAAVDAEPVLSKKEQKKQAKLAKRELHNL